MVAWQPFGRHQSDSIRTPIKLDIVAETAMAPKIVESLNKFGGEKLYVDNFAYSKAEDYMDKSKTTFALEWLV